MELDLYIIVEPPVHDIGRASTIDADIKATTNPRNLYIPIRGILALINLLSINHDKLNICVNLCSDYGRKYEEININYFGCFYS